MLVTVPLKQTPENANFLYTILTFPLFFFMIITLVMTGDGWDGWMDEMKDAERVRCDRRKREEIIKSNSSFPIFHEFQ